MNEDYLDELAARWDSARAALYDFEVDESPATRLSDDALAVAAALIVLAAVIREESQR